MYVFTTLRQLYLEKRECVHYLREYKLYCQCGTKKKYIIYVLPFPRKQMSLGHPFFVCVFSLVEGSNKSI